MQKYGDWHRYIDVKPHRKRIFNLTDDVLVETSSTMHQLFVENISDFNAFDPEQKQKTFEVKIIVEQAVEKYNEVKYFVKKAFKNKQIHSLTLFLLFLLIP